MSKKEVTDKRSLSHMFRRYVGDQPVMMAAVALVSVAAGICESVILALVAAVATGLVSGGPSAVIKIGSASFAPSARVALSVAFGFAVSRLVLQVPLSYFPARLAADRQAHLRLSLFRAFSAAPWAAKAVDAEGGFQEIATDQIYQATLGVVNATSALTAFTMVIVLVAAALVVNVVTALLVIIAGVALFVLFRPLGRLARRQAVALSRFQLEYASLVHDAVSMAEEVQVFGVGRAQEGQLARAVGAVQRQYRKTQTLVRYVPGAYQCIIYLLLLAGLSLLIAFERSRAAEASAVILLLIRASTFGQNLQASIVGMFQSLPFMDQVSRATERYEIPSPIRGSERPEAGPDLSVQGLNYQYVSGRPVLKNLSFLVPFGEAIGIVGPTGAGKSTLAQLLLGLREVTSGDYRVAGVAAQDWDPRYWANTFAYVPQEPRLLQGSIRANIAFYRDFDDGTIEWAAEAAQIHEEICQFPDGYSSIVSQRAMAVSGGQRQRLCLARALATQPRVLILDEPTSQLDAQSEALVQKTLEGLKGKLTLVIVAHRLVTLSLCDKVLVLREGRLEAFGTPRTVQQENEFFRSASLLSGIGDANPQEGGALS
jgi:ATP-binding cassette subfamily B protein